MADNYIEAALMSHSAAFADATGAMTVACPQIADALNVLYGYIKRLQGESATLRDQLTAAQRDIGTLREAAGASREQHKRTDLLLESLQSESHGFVTMERLRNFCASFVDRGIVNALRADVDELVKHSKTTANQRDLDLLEKVVTGHTEGIEVYRKTFTDDLGIVRSTLDRMTGDLNVKIEQHMTEYKKHVDAFAALQESTKDALLRLNERLANEVQIARHEAAEQLQATHAEVLFHMKTHAEAIDKVQRMRTETIARAPTVVELKEARVEMDRLKADLDKSQFRIHEAYSQCLALAKVGAGGVSDSRSRGRQSTNGQHALGADVAKGIPEKWESDDTAEVMMLRNQSRNSTSVLQQFTHSSAFSTSGTSPMPASVELQMEMLRKDVHKLLNVALPSCVGQVLTLKEDVSEVVAMQQRAETLVQSLCFCLGLENQGDELLACLRATDRNRVLLLLRRCFETIVGGKTHARSGVDKSSSLSGTPHLGASTSAAPTTPKSLISSMVTEPQFRLGIDVADAITTKGKIRGAQVMSVLPGSAAAQAGVLQQDIVTAVNGTSISSCGDFVRELKVATASARIALSGKGDPQRHFLDLELKRLASGTQESVQIPIVFC